VILIYLNLRTRLLLPFFCLVASVNISGQQWIDESKVLALNKSFYNVYNLDGHLINGRKYYNRYSNAPGHPFFMDDQFKKGKLIVNGIAYDNIHIKFDIVNQEIILQFSYIYGGNNQIILNSENVSEFELGGKLFRRYELPGKGNNFLQAVVEDKITCLYSWQKHLISQRYSLENPYLYSDQESKSYLLINKQFIEYRGKKSFIKIFPRELHQDIKRFFKTNNIKLNSASDNTISQLINYCSQIYDPSESDINP
jgi:hypothetical protein